MNEKIKRVSVVFKTLANINRIKIVKILLKGERLSVKELAAKLNISVPSASRHLLLLSDLDVLNFEGKDNHVFYFINKNIPMDFRKAIELLQKQSS